MGQHGGSKSVNRQGRLIPAYLAGEGQVPHGDVLNQFNPPQEAVLSQLNEALRTGGIGARIPIAQQSVAQTSSATNQGLRELQGRLDAQGLGGSTYGNRVYEGARLQGAQEIAQIPTSIAYQEIQQAPQFVQNVMGQILAALAAQGGGRSRSFNV